MASATFHPVLERSEEIARYETKSNRAKEETHPNA